MNRLFMVGLNFRTTPLSVRERFSVPASRQEAVAREIRRDHRLSEVVVLSTCNRIEVYGVSVYDPPQPDAILRSLTNAPLPAGNGVYAYYDADAARHLFSVAGGLDSMVLGETEITGQVKTSYENARKAGLTGKCLNRLFQKSLETAKAIRSTTAIGKGTASVGSVAVKQATRILGSSLAGRRIMVIGAGSVAEKCLRHLVKKGAESLVVVNRSHDRAETLAAAYGGTAVAFGRCLDAMTEVDIVITSTGCPHLILDRSDIEAVMAARPDRPLVIMDIAVPRDVAPEARAIPNVHLHNIEDLEETVHETIRIREQELHACQVIIDTKASEWDAREHASTESLCEV